MHDYVLWASRTQAHTNTLLLVDKLILTPPPTLLHIFFIIHTLYCTLLPFLNYAHNVTQKSQARDMHVIPQTIALVQCPTINLMFTLELVALTLCILLIFMRFIV